MAMCDTTDDNINIIKGLADNISVTKIQVQHLEHLLKKELEYSAVTILLPQCLTRCLTR